jgi:hemoglobin
MRRVRLWKAAWLLCALVGLTAGVVRGDEEKKGEDKTMTAPLDRKVLDETVYKTLRDVINQGADLFNSGDRAACYRLWEGSLKTLRPLLDHKPEMQKAVSTSLTNAERNADMGARCFVLREALDKIRNDIHPAPKLSPGSATGPRPVVTRQRTIWEELGGEPGVKKIVDDLVAKAGADRRVDFSRGGKYKPTEEEVVVLKKKLIDQISDISGGPYKYTGKTMKAAHMGMGITNDQFDAFAEDFKAVLETNKVKPEVITKVLDVVGSTRKDIVEPKKPSPPPPEDKKEDKKPEETGTVKGKVTLTGKPLAAGTIEFHGADGKSVKGVTDADGSYVVKGLKPGEYMVAISTDAKDVKVPAKFADAKTSGLKIEVKAGSQNHDIALQE